MLTSPSLHKMGKRNVAVATAIGDGWGVRLAKNGHLILECPYGCCRVIASPTPSDWRGAKNAASLVKRCPKRRPRKGGC